MLNPDVDYDREKARQGYRTGMQWKVLLVSTALAAIALAAAAVLAGG